ncbi:MAG TPA: putative manganese transporter [Candidatus Woesebacteria bacterium]|nr:putative manganese transporter [Candidatus Woesebacteria bacterium]
MKWFLIKEALVEALKTFPFLLGIYLVVEYFESNFRYQRRLGPIIGALLGAIPRCGFSILTTGFYLAGRTTLGTLLAVYLATSDEALPILLAYPDKIKFVFPLVFFKVIYAAVVGLIIDLLFPHNQLIPRSSVKTESACCGQHQSFSFHPLTHALKLTGYIFGLNLILGWIFELFHPAVLLNPFLAAIIGLIPNCAASVFLTEAFLKNVISFGSLFAGLCASAGLGLFLLFKESDSYHRSFVILALLYIFSVLGGFMIQSILG